MIKPGIRIPTNLDDFSRLMDLPASPSVIGNKLQKEGAAREVISTLEALSQV
jgi:hypothetical protein